VSVLHVFISRWETSVSQLIKLHCFLKLLRVHDADLGTQMYCQTILWYFDSSSEYYTRDLKSP